MLLEKQTATLLLKQQKTIAIAESCTGGLLSMKLTNISGSSQYFIAGIVAYSNLAKTKVLGISKTILKKNGAVSSPVALGMARNIKKKFRTHFGLGITGIAGPSGGTKTKPVGLVYIAISGPQNICQAFHFKGTRASIREQASQKAMELLLHFLK